MAARANGSDIVIDVGATNIRIGIPSVRIAPPALVLATPAGGAEVVSVICKGITRVLASHDRLSRVAVACPGLVTRSGQVANALHIDLSGIALREELQNHLNVDVIVENDANVQALGASRKLESMVYMVIGTGVGGAFIERGQLVVGRSGFSGELGHLPLGTTGTKCVCGQVGCLDATASGWALERQLGVNWWSRPLPAESLVHLYRAGIQTGRVLATASKMLDPHRALLAGNIVRQRTFREGVLQSWRMLVPEYDIDFTAETWPSVVQGLVKLLQPTN